MYLVTNRRINERGRSPALFGKKPSEHGPNEIRIVEATRKQSKWACRVLPDTVTDANKREVHLSRTSS